MSAYTSAHSLVRLEMDVLQYQPDVVLVAHDINDLLVVYYAASLGRPVDANYNVKYDRKSLTSVIDDSDVVVSRLFALIRGRLEHAPPPAPAPALEQYDLETGRRIFERNLRSMVAVARAQGTEVVFVTMPVARSKERFDDATALARGGLLDALPSHDRFLADFDRYNETVRALGKELGVNVIDAASLVAPDDRYFEDIVHTTTEGVRAMGQAVGGKLLEILPPRKDGPADAPR
jgi:lysophospholipase L1-like esterase